MSFYRSNIFFNSIFNKLPEKTDTGWKAVGSNPATSSEEVLYIVEFQSKRLVVCFIDSEYKVNFNFEDSGIKEGEAVIIEADRGEDCGTVAGVLEKKKFYEFLYSSNCIHGTKIHPKDIDFNNFDLQSCNINSEVTPKKIYRKANNTDLEKLQQKREEERIALEHCTEAVNKKGYEMNVLSAEYQWDLSKLTFYFESEKIIDFRELVKELYIKYKVRIWMCSVDKSKISLMRKLLK